MPFKRQYVKLFLKLLLMLVEATISAIILSFIITEYVSPEVFFSLFFFPEEYSVPYPYNFSGIVVIVLGAILIIWANFVLLFVGKIGLETREPFHVPSTLVIKGPYKFSRNPIYLSVIIILLGLAILASSLSIFIVAIVLFFIFQKWFVSWEEKKLEERFGEEYLVYKSRVRRWF